MNCTEHEVSLLGEFVMKEILLFITYYMPEEEMKTLTS